MGALYLPKAEKILPGARVVTAFGEAFSLEVGQVLTSASGDLLRLQSDGRVALRLYAKEPLSRSFAPGTLRKET